MKKNEEFFFFGFGLIIKITKLLSNILTVHNTLITPDSRKYLN